MRRLIYVLSFVVLWPLAGSWAQLRAPNEAGVALGHWHTIVRDVEGAKKFWSVLGGTPIQIDGTDVMKFPGVLVFLAPGAPTGGTRGTTINHVGFGARNVQQLFAQVRAANLPGIRADDPRKSPLNGQDVGDLFTPDELMIEITEHGGVAPYPMIPAGTDLESNHMHFFVPEAQRKELQAWYANTFGGETGVLRDALVVSLPGMKFMRVAPCGSEYSACGASSLPTKGRALDHIGFEVKNLEAFCKKLEANGVKLDAPYSKSRHKSFASAELTDPWGVSIELTEGLSRF